jgi:hypothetical protein
MNNLAEHEADQAEIIGDGTPYEVRLEARISKALSKQPGITPATLRCRLGYVMDGCFTLTLERMIERGIIKSVPTKYGLTVSQ